MKFTSISKKFSQIVNLKGIFICKCFQTPPVVGTPMTPQEQIVDESSQPPPAYAESPGAYQQAYQQPPQV